MMDHLLTALKNRLEAYIPISGSFSFLSKVSLANDDQLSDGAERLMETHPEYLNTSFSEEIIYFQESINEPESDVWLRLKGEKRDTFPEQVHLLIVFFTIIQERGHFHL